MKKTKKINKIFVKKYYNKWIGEETPSINSYRMFLNMLTNKAYYSKINKREYYCYDGLYGAHEIEDMLIIAEDNKDFILSGK